MHPVTAARVLSTFGAKGGRMLDPFCGSGTVLVEARLAGMNAKGTDVNPLALRLARLKTSGLSDSVLHTIVDAAREVCELAEQRRLQKLAPFRRYPPEDAELFAPHVLLELDSLREGISAQKCAVLLALELVLSSVLTKVSRRTGDSASRLAEKRLAGGFVTRFFWDRTRELCDCVHDFARLCTENCDVEVGADDARELRSVASKSIDLVVTSPPYAGTYDYLSHHDVRLRWLQLTESDFRDRELGSRREFAALSPEIVRKKWASELELVLSSIARCLRPKGLAVLLLGDSATGGVALRADDLVASVASDSGLLVGGIASQERPHFHTASARAFSHRPRMEHLILLAKP
jgi:SAM-dependent methyltransferase